MARSISPHSVRSRAEPAPTLAATSSASLTPNEAAASQAAVCSAGSRLRHAVSMVTRGQRDLNAVARLNAISVERNAEH